MLNLHKSNILLFSDSSYDIFFEELFISTTILQYNDQTGLLN